MADFFSQLLGVVRKASDTMIDELIKKKFDAFLLRLHEIVERSKRQLFKNLTIDYLSLFIGIFCLSSGAKVFAAYIFLLFGIKWIVYLATNIDKFLGFMKKNRILERCDFKRKDERLDGLGVKAKIKEVGFRLFNSYYDELAPDKVKQMHGVFSSLGAAKGNREIYEDVFAKGIVAGKAFLKEEATFIVIIMVIYPLLWISSRMLLMG